MSARPLRHWTLVLAISVILLGGSLGIVGTAVAPLGSGTTAGASAVQSSVAPTPASAPSSTGVAGHLAPPHADSGQPVPPGPAAEARLEAAIHAQHVDPRKIYPPNLEYAPTLRNGMVVAPSYPQAPEPAGLADYGVMNSTGTPTPFTIDTTSYRASVDLNSVSPYYLANGVPEGFTSQLNVVLSNVTLHGQSGYTFWTQNVFFYDAYSSQLFIENNIWNFSAAPPAPQPVNTFFYLPGYTNGSDNPAIGYYAAGTPTFNDVLTPFTVVFYINATTLLYQGSAYTEVNFAFNLLNAVGVQIYSDQYDRALFNDTGGPATIPQAQFHVDGSQLTPTGFIPYDAEVMLGGPGGGSTATFNAINATMTLQHWNASAGAYVNEPSAWSSGSETGETAVGISEFYASNHVVHLSGGPEFIQPFWNSSATVLPGASTIAGTITPSNSWAFVTEGSAYNSSTSTWAPIPPSGNIHWTLTNGVYSVHVMESDYTAYLQNGIAVSPTSPATVAITLASNPLAGVYTPLYAYANSQLAAISSAGTGTGTNPYVLFNNEYGPLAPEFATFNDYAFPSYAGISLVGTSAHVLIQNPAPFTVDYWGTYATDAQFYSVPTTNELSIWSYETSNVSILGGTITGWFSANQAGFPFANVLLWNTSSALVAGVTFDVLSNAIFTYGGSGNTFTANTFQNSVLPGTFMPGLIAPYGTVASGAPLAVSQNEGGDLYFNNYFATTVTAFETNYNVFDDLYPTALQNYTNNWNLTAPIAAGSVLKINGITVPTQSLTGNSTLCGNFWWNYVSGAGLPYDNFGYIITGGDYCPAGPTLYPVPVVETGLPAGTPWSATILPAASETLPFGGTATGTGILSFQLPAGEWYIVFSGPVGYQPIPALDLFQIQGVTGAIYNASGPIAAESVVFTPLSGTVVFAAGGLPAGTSWSVTVGTTSLSGTSSALAATLAFGTYTYTVGPVAGYIANPASGSVAVPPGGTATVSIAYSPANLTDGNLSGTVSPASASVFVDGASVTITGGTFNVSLVPGVHSVEAMATGFYTYFNNVTISGGTTTHLIVGLNPISPTSGGNGQLELVVSPTAASASVDGVAVTLTSGSFTGNFTPGVHSVTISASGYYTYYNNVTVSSNHTLVLNVALNPVASPSSSTGISDTAWAIIGVLAVLAVVLLVTTLLFAARRRPVQMAPEPPTPPKQ